MIMVLKCFPYRIHDWGIVLVLLELSKFSTILAYSLMMFGCVLLILTEFYLVGPCFCQSFMVAVNDQIFLPSFNLTWQQVYLLVWFTVILGSNWYLGFCTAVAVTGYAWDFVCHLSTGIAVTKWSCDACTVFFWIWLCCCYLNHLKESGLVPDFLFMDSKVNGHVLGHDQHFNF